MKSGRIRYEELNVYSTKTVSKVPLEICDKETLLKYFTDDGFHATDNGEFLKFLSADGDESYTVCYDREAISKSKSGDLLYLALLMITRHPVLLRKIQPAV